MTTYRVRLNAYNPWHPEYGTAQVIVRVGGYDLDDALNNIRSVHMSADGKTVTTSWHILTRGTLVGPCGYSFPCWDIVTPPRAVKGEGPGSYLIEHVKPTRTIANVSR